MDWKLFLTVLSTVFIAELGDKTQLATFSYATGGKPWVVFAASSVALILASAMGVFFAQGIAQLISPETLKKVAAGLFIGIGMWMFWRG